MRSWRRQWHTSKVRRGDGSALRPLRVWQLLTRSLFSIDLVEPDGRAHRYAVDVRLLADGKSKAEHEAGKGAAPAALYRDGIQVARGNLPLSFPVPGGVVDVGISGFGVKRMHYVDGSGDERLLRPDSRSREGRRAMFDRRHPGLSRVIAAASVVLLVIALLVGLGELAESLSTGVPAIRESVGVVRSPVPGSTWAKVAVFAIGFVGAFERSLRVRHHWLLDSAGS